jgi:hypothetical protein
VLVQVCYKTASRRDAADVGTGRVNQKPTSAAAQQQQQWREQRREQLKCQSVACTTGRRAKNLLPWQPINKHSRGVMLGHVPRRLGTRAYCMCKARSGVGIGVGGGGEDQSTIGCTVCNHSNSLPVRMLRTM